MNNDTLIIGGHEFNSRFILGSGKYSMKLIDAAVKDAGAEIITLAVRRANTSAPHRTFRFSFFILPLLSVEKKSYNNFLIPLLSATI